MSEDRLNKHETPITNSGVGKYTLLILKTQTDISKTFINCQTQTIRYGKNAQK